MLNKISVIIPVKNGAQTLEKCLSKIRSQTIDDIEIIVLDSFWQVWKPAIVRH